MRKILLLILLLSLLAIPSSAAPPTRTYSYTSGSVIDPDEVGANEDSIYTYLQGGIDTIKDGVIVNADISSSAAIADSKLAQITTASKISGTSITGLASTPSGAGALPIANGGTNATTASGARTALGVAIGSNVQAWDTQLEDISALAVTNSNFIVGDGTNWVVESGATARASLSAASSGANSDITSLASLSTPLSVAQGGTGRSTGNIGGSQLFTSDGNFTAPTGVTQVYITMVAGGASGGAGVNATTGGGGGGAGEAIIKQPYTVTAESTYAVDVGAAGANSTFNTTGVVATAGTAGSGATAGSGGGVALDGTAGASGGTAGGSNGFKGGSGGTGQTGGGFVGGGGGGTPWGTGGAGGSAAVGAVGTGYGAGGGGGSGNGGNLAGGAGTAGFVLVQY